VPLDALGRSLELTDPLLRTEPPAFITFSGGVAEYIFRRETAEHGDIARLLAAGIVKQLKARVRVPVVEPLERIRATVIGASQFTVQVSGKTIYLPQPEVLPVHNVPVVHLAEELADDIDVARVVAGFTRQAALLDLPPDARLALAFAWHGEPEHARLLAMGRAIMKFAAPSGLREQPLFLVIAGDVAASLGRVLREELGLRGPLVSIDGIQLRELDFVDVGALIDPPAVVPVVIKSLLFPADGPMARPDGRKR
jgi:ethanolamine utilization protein EutA